MNKQYRVKKTKEIEKILNARKCYANAIFSVFKIQNNETNHFRYAISVGKKLGKAVVRNKLKRQIRAIVSSLDIKLDENIDVFIIAKNKILDLNYQEMAKQLEYLFKKQKLIKGEKND